MMKQENKINLLKNHGKTCFPACFVFGNYFVIFCIYSVSVKRWYCRKPGLSCWIVKANQNKINLTFLVSKSLRNVGIWPSSSLKEICLRSSPWLEKLLEGSILKSDLDWLKWTVPLFIPQGVPISDLRIQKGNIVKNARSEWLSRQIYPTCNENV